MGSADSHYAVEALELMDEIEARSDLAHLTRRLSEFLATFGFNKFMLTHTPLPRERLGPSMIVREWPLDFLYHYDAQRFYRDDPVADRVFTTTDAFVWSDVPIDPIRLPRGRRIMGEAADAGMRDGFCVPVQDVNGFQGAVSMAGDRIELPPRARRAVHMVALVAFGVAGRHLGQAAGRRRLSGREREVLQHFGAGLSGAEVSEKLGVSCNTVATLLGRARDKLGTLNTTHTVVEALRARQISL